MFKKTEKRQYFMACADDSVNAKSMAVDRLSKVAAAGIARFSGFEMLDDPVFPVLSNIQRHSDHTANLF